MKNLGRFKPHTALGMILFHGVAAYAILRPILFRVHYSAAAWVSFVLTWFIVVGVVTVGNHRYFTHRSYECSAWFKKLLIFFEPMAVQGPILWWVKVHLQHHTFTDRAGDPHRPSEYGGGVLGFLWSHMLWMSFEIKAAPPEYGEPANLRELREDPWLRWQEKSYVYLPLMLSYYLALYLIAGTGGFLLGVCALVISWHLSWSVNSACHTWGSHARDASGEEMPTKNAKNFPAACLWNLYAIATGGECRHANHHALQGSAYFGWRWYELDPGGLMIRIGKWFGWIWNVRSPEFGH